VLSYYGLTIINVDLSVTTHLAEGQPCTWFHDGSDSLPAYEAWADAVADCLLKGDTEGLKNLMQKLATGLEEIQKQIHPAQQMLSKCGTTSAFGSYTSWHAGVGPIIGGAFRFVVYCQAVPAFLAEAMQKFDAFSEYLASRYTAEFVLDRESMLDPEVLVSLLRMNHKKKSGVKLTDEQEKTARQFIQNVIDGQSCSS
jgi:hypothetical protein